MEQATADVAVLDETRQNR